MRLTIKVKPNSRQNMIEEKCANTLTVRIKAPAREGKANEAVISLLSDYFDLPKSRISVIRGHTSKNKIIEIL